MTMNYNVPDDKGWYGEYGGMFVSETLMEALISLRKEFESIKDSEEFKREYDEAMADYVGGPSPVYYAERLSDHLGGARIYFKREDLNHTGSHKVNNTLGQVLLAKHMGKKRVIAETGAGQHGVATATLAAKFGMECEVFMGEVDVHRQSPNILRMKILGASVRSIKSGSKTLKDAMNEAMRDWVARVDDTFYVIGTCAGPHPYPQIVAYFQSIIGENAIRQMKSKIGRLPDYAVACVGGGSNAIGLFRPFVPYEEVKLVGVEAGGHGLSTGEHAAPISSRSPKGILHGFASRLMQDPDGQIIETHSISAGLDYPGVGPEHSYLDSIGRATYESANDDEALEAFFLASRMEGIIPALESSHAIAWAVKNAPKMDKDKVILVNVSGRGDKDLNTIAKIEGIEID